MLGESKGRCGAALLRRRRGGRYAPGPTRQNRDRWHITEAGLVSRVLRRNVEVNIAASMVFDASCAELPYPHCSLAFGQFLSGYSEGAARGIISTKVISPTATRIPSECGWHAWLRPFASVLAPCRHLPGARNTLLPRSATGLGRSAFRSFWTVCWPRVYWLTPPRPRRLAGPSLAVLGTFLMVTPSAACATSGQKRLAQDRPPNEALPEFLGVGMQRGVTLNCEEPGMPT